MTHEGFTEFKFLAHCSDGDLEGFNTIAEAIEKYGQ
jgi:hypothetical protein